jgi:hypothetical protein
MAGKPPWSNAVAVSDIASQILDPVLRKRTGMSVALVQSWEEIVGERLASKSRPEKIQWRRKPDDDSPFEPATMVIAADGLAALQIQHETTEIIARINAFLGYGAIGRVRIVQKPVLADTKPRRQPPRSLSTVEKAKIDRAVSAIEDDELKASLARLGASVLGSRDKRS